MALTQFRLHYLSLPPHPYQVRDDQAKFFAFVCSSDNETMRNIYDEGRWPEWVDANISFMQKTFGK